MDRCEICTTNAGNISAVVGGTYYKHVCSVCNSKERRVSSGDARWQRTIDTEDHQFDLAQPRNADGTPNVDFIKAYPAQSSAVFTTEEMAKALRR